MSTLKVVKDNKISSKNSYMFVTLLWVLFLFIIVGVVFKLSFVSLLFNLTFIVLLLAILGFFFTKSFNYNEMVLLTLIIAFTIINVSIKGEKINFDYYSKAIIFISTILMLYIVTKLSVNDIIVQTILYINIVIAVLFVVAYFILGINTTIANGITLNFNNPNLTGLFVLHSALYVFISISFFNSRAFKMFLFLIETLLIIIMFNTLSRACIMAYFFFILLTILKHRINIKSNIFAFFISILPALVLIVYFIAIETNIITIFSFFSSEGKELASRYNIWISALTVLKDNLLLGNYYLISDGSGRSQMHNIHLDVATSYGMIVFTLFIIFLYQVIKKINIGKKNNSQIFALLAFFTIMFLSAFEAAFVSGGLGIYIMSTGFLIIAKKRG